MHQPDTGGHTPISRRSMAIAAFSTVVEWYDFTLYLYLTTVLARVFFGGGQTSVLATLAGFAIAYAMRPLGAAIFAHVGDRFGRRRVLLLSIGLMTFAMLATALMPDHRQIGPLSGWLLLSLRCLTAFSVGGEYTSAVAYLTEGAAENRRGLIASSAAAASEIGALLAVAVSALTVSLTSPQQLDAWGWRIPFLIGALLAAAIWAARSRMQESPSFERRAAAGRLLDAPLRHTLHAHRPALARTFTISALGSITYYVGITWIPTFLHSTGSANERDSLWLSTLAACAVIVVTPMLGALSDHLGRKPVLIAITAISVIAPSMIFTSMAQGSHLQIITGAIGLAALAGGVSAVAASATAEQFPVHARLSGLALGVTAATAVFGGLTPLLAQWLIGHTGWAAAPGAMIAIVALLALPVLIGMPETNPALTRRG